MGISLPNRYVLLMRLISGISYREKNMDEIVLQFIILSNKNDPGKDGFSTGQFTGSLVNLLAQ